MPKLKFSLSEAEWLLRRFLALWQERLGQQIVPGVVLFAAAVTDKRLK